MSHGQNETYNPFPICVFVGALQKLDLGSEYKQDAFHEHCLNVRPAFS